MKGNAIINQKKVQFDAKGGMHLLDFIRNDLQLKGTKEACREGDCGSCIVLLGQMENSKLTYRIVNSCMYPLGEISNKHVVTVEGLTGQKMSMIQQLMIDEWASQCGFCTPGFIVSMTGYFLQAKTLNVDDAISFLGGNICRCTGYHSIKRAMIRLCESLDQVEFEQSYNENRINHLVKTGFLPAYFEQISTLLAEIPASGQPKTYHPGDIILAGGTDLYIQKGEIISSQEPYFIRQNEHFRGIRRNGKHLIIGSATTVTELEESELFRQIVPGFSTYSRLISGASIRNMATIGGNLINASPIGDLSILFLALNAAVKLDLSGKERIIPLKHFFLDYKKLDLQAGELLNEVMIPLDITDANVHFEKVSRRTHLDIASVNSAMSIKSENGIICEIHAAAGGVGPVPLYLKGVCEYLQNKIWDDQVVEEGIQIALNEISPISDVRGSKQYKHLLLEQQLRIHFSVLAEKNRDHEKL
jgi:xanthine dehydrogenase small subunit